MDLGAGFDGGRLGAGVGTVALQARLGVGGDSVALCQCVAQELGHAELSMNSEVYSRRDMGFQAVCIGYMLCKKYGVDTQNFAIDRIPDELKNKEPKDIKAELGKTQKAFKEITARVSDELYRQRAERSKEQER